jgi:hypothetical protein
MVSSSVLDARFVLLRDSTSLLSLTFVSRQIELTPLLLQVTWLFGPSSGRGAISSGSGLSPFGPSFPPPLKANAASVRLARSIYATLGLISLVSVASLLLYLVVSLSSQRAVQLGRVKLTRRIALRQISALREGRGKRAETNRAVRAFLSTDRELQQSPGRVLNSS